MRIGNLGAPGRRGPSGRWGFVSVLVVAGCAGLGWPASASACSCQPLTPEQARQQADAVFEGRVVAISAEQPDPHVGPGINRVVMRVVRTWKNADREQVEVRTAQNEAACGFPFAPDRSYLVYARQVSEPDEGLRTGLCSRTRPIEDAQEDLNALGAGVTPVEVDDETGDRTPATAAPRPSAGGCRSCAAAEGQTPISGWLLPGIVWAALATRRLRGACATRRD